jgi:hypothetical protein
MIDQLQRFAMRTPARTFVIYPIVVLLAALLGRRGHPRIAWQFAPILLWGYLQYRLCGKYRRGLGGGGPGIEVPPDDLVLTGPYAVVRNPMYLGHLIFLTGLALMVRTKLAIAVAAATALWFNERRRGSDRAVVQRARRRGRGAPREAVRRPVPGLPGPRTALDPGHAASKPARSDAQ